MSKFGNDNVWRSKKHLANPHCRRAGGVRRMLLLKVRVTALGGDPSASWFSYILSLALDPWVWSAVIAAVGAGLLYVISLRQLELSVVEPLFALVFVAPSSRRAYFRGTPTAASNCRPCPYFRRCDFKSGKLHKPGPSPLLGLADKVIE